MSLLETDVVDDYSRNYLGVLEFHLQSLQERYTQLLRYWATFLQGGGEKSECKALYNELREINRQLSLHELKYEKIKKEISGVRTLCS